MLTKYKVPRALSDRARMNDREILVKRKLVQYVMDFLRAHRGDFILKAIPHREPVRFVSYSSFVKFKQNVRKLNKGYYIAHIQMSRAINISIPFYKK